MSNLWCCHAKFLWLTRKLPRADFLKTHKKSKSNKKIWPREAWVVPRQRKFVRIGWCRLTSTTSSLIWWKQFRLDRYSCAQLRKFNQIFVTGLALYEDLYNFRLLACPFDVTASKPTAFYPGGPTGSSKRFEATLAVAWHGPISGL